MEYNINEINANNHIQHRHDNNSYFCLDFYLFLLEVRVLKTILILLAEMVLVLFLALLEKFVQVFNDEFRIEIMGVD